LATGCQLFVINSREFYLKGAALLLVQTDSGEMATLPQES